MEEGKRINLGSMKSDTLKKAEVEKSLPLQEEHQQTMSLLWVVEGKTQLHMIKQKTILVLRRYTSMLKYLE